MNEKVKRITDHIVEDILKWTGENTDLAQQVAEKLAGLDWQQVLLEKRHNDIQNQMRTMERFLDWIKEGGVFCDACGDSQPANTLVGEYPDPQYRKVYSWPYAVSPSVFAEDDPQGHHYCWKCFYKMQESLGNRLFREDQEKHRSFFQRWMSGCSECGRLIPQKSGHRLESISRGPYCLHCMRKAVEYQFIFCQHCGKKTASSLEDYCYDCYPMYRAYGSQVSYHLGRARAAGTPATLTVPQWMATVNYFHEKCAYCQSRPSQAVEHFLPISLGGGTTQDFSRVGLFRQTLLPLRA